MAALLLGRIGEAGVDGDDPVKAGQLEDPHHSRGGPDERQAPAVGLQPSVSPDEHVQRGRVDEREAGRVNDEQRLAAGGRRAQRLRQRRDGGDVGLPGQPHDDGVIGGLHADR